MATKELTPDQIAKVKLLSEAAKAEARMQFKLIDEEAAASRRAAHERDKAAADGDARNAARQLRSFYSADETRQLLANISAEVCV